MLAYKSGLSGGQYRYQLSTVKPIRDIYPFNAWNVLAVSDSGKIWRTSTLTSPFAVMTQTQTTQKLNRIFGKNDNQIWIAGDHGTLLMSPDNGLNWNLISIPTILNINAGLVKGSIVWICGDNGLILYSKDNGASWFTEASNTISNLKDIKSIGNNLYTVGENGTLMTINLILGNELLEQNQPIRLIQENGQLILACDPNGIRNVLIYNLQGREIPITSHIMDSRLALDIRQSGFFVVRIETVGEATQFRKVLFSN